MLVNDPRAGGIIAVFRRIAHGIAHIAQATLVEQVHDQLQFVQRLEIGGLRLIAGLDHRLEGHLDERRHPATEQHLLAEEVGLGLFLEGRLQDPGTSGPDALGVGETVFMRLAARVLPHGQQRRHAATVNVDLPHAMARPLGRHHAHVHVGRRHDLVVVDVETVCPHERLPLAHVGRYFLAVEVALDMIRDHEHHEIGAPHGVSHVGHVEARLPRRLARPAARVQPDDHLYAAVLQVEAVSVALTAVTQHCDALPGQATQISIAVVVNPCHTCSPSYLPHPPP